MQPEYLATGKSPLPTKQTLGHRRNPFYQLIRFAALNLKMIRIIRKGGKA